MGAVLHSLRERGLERIQTYLPDTRGEYVARHGGDLWQVSPYRDGVFLPRPGYIRDGWRGSALAPGLPRTDRRPFSILHFIDDLRARMKRHNPAVLEEVEAVIRFLFADFGAVHDRLPVLFCHGDLHPVNVIWSGQGIACVIDWEFMGFKPEVYDAANLIGCIGMEHPEGLTGHLVRDFLDTLDRANLFSPLGRRWLAEAVVALRFAWLSEWLRKRDREMVDLEVVYLKLLMENRDFLREEWERVRL
jgi:homoserine kinase type II